jgi:hypothetical protein
MKTRNSFTPQNTELNNEKQVNNLHILSDTGKEFVKICIYKNAKTT